MDMELPGNISEGTFTSEKHKKNMIFSYKLYIPSFVEKNTECAIIIDNDCLNTAEAYAVEQLAKSEEVPPCISVGISSSVLPRQSGENNGRNMRMDNYDLFCREYPDFIVEEFIPYLINQYNLHISPSPDMHMASGGSSGGISAFNMAWFRNDFFRRVYMSSPTFSAMGNGHEYPVLIRKTETKPIRIYEEFSEHEPDDYFGNSYCAALEGKYALEFSKYDMACSYFPGEGHCSRIHDKNEAVKRMKFIWKDWKTHPIAAGGLSARAEKLISLDFSWEEVFCPFPDKVKAISNGTYTAAGEYISDGDKIFFVTESGKKLAASGFRNISSLAVSSDKERLYIADKDMGCVYSAVIEKDGNLSGRYIHGVLHRAADFRYPGAFDICVDEYDRIYAATEVGIQSIRSFGLIDVIISVPFNLTADKIEFGQSDRNYLYVQSSGRVFRRRLFTPGRPDIGKRTEPAFIGYYD